MKNINQKIINLSEEKRALLKIKLKNKTSSKCKTISPRENRDSVPLSFAQQRLWFLEQLEPNSPFYNIAKAACLTGEINTVVLREALEAIVVHHEILRTNYIAENGNPIQVIAAPQAVELQILDLQQYGQAEQENQVQKLLQQEIKRPFNLESDMMLRGCLLQLAPQEHVLLLVMHHIASDGWSMGILWQQLTQLYQALLDGQPNPLETLPIQYADYAVWQREWLSGEVLDQQLNYWKKQLAGANPLLELPTDHHRPAVQTYRGASQSLLLPQSLSNGLKELCRQEGVTLYMTLLAAFQTLLYRYSRQDDIIVGSPIAGRNRAELEGLIGFFVNTLVLRTDLSGNPSFLELLRRVRSITLDAYSHQDLPFDKLVEKLNPERSLSYSPLFQVMFVLQNTPGQTGQLLGSTETPVQLQAETAKFDLTLSVREKDGTLVSLWNYNTDLFDADTIEQMTAHFQTLLEAIVANPQQPIAQLPLLTKAERQQLLVEWNDTEAEYPQKCVHQLFEEQVERTPDAVAVVFEGQQLTYGELNSRANQLAHYLQKLGVKPDVLVGLCVERSLEMIVGMLGILKAGGAYVPIDPDYPQERLAFILEDTQASVLLTQEKWLQRLPNDQLKVICLDSESEEIAQNSQDAPFCEATPDSLIYIIYTSGSTGKPKGVMIPHRGICNMLYWKQSNFKLSATDKVLQTFPFSFDGSVCQIFWPLCFGGQLILACPDGHKDPAYLVKIISEQQITTIGLVPSILRFLLEEKGIEHCQSLKHAVCGAEPLGLELVERFCKRLNLDNVLQNEYGPTEASMITSYWVCQGENNYTIAPIGRPIDNFQVYVLDEYLQPVPVGQPGELHIGGVGLARGYLNRPELTAEKFIPNPFSKEAGASLYKTGDSVRYLPDGNIEFLGRIDSQVKIRGFRIELGEIEAVLAQHPDIDETVVIAREDIPGNQRLVAYIVPQQEQPHSSRELRSFVQEHLPNYMVPSAFVFLDAMPLNSSGKIDRRNLPVPDKTRQELSDTFTAPQEDKLELELTKIWEQVLGIQPISVEDNFFDLGGNSLQAVTLFAQIEKRFGKKLPLATLFQSGTVTGIAQIIRQQNWLAPWESLVPIQPNGNKPPLFYIHPGGGNLLIYRNLADSLGSDQPVYGLQPRGLDGRYAPLSRIEDMAAFYLAEIRRIQPNGPYFLAGLSSGGVTAWEIARMVHAQGDYVAMLALFDTNGPDCFKLLPPLPRLLTILKWSGWDFLHRVSRLYQTPLSKFTQLGTKHISILVLQRLGIVKRVVTEDQKIQKNKVQIIFGNRLAMYKSNSSNISLMERWVNSIVIFLLRNSSSPAFRNLYVRVLCRDVVKDKSEILGNAVSEIPGNDISEIPEELKQVQESNLNAHLTYVPKAYPGRIILFRASECFPGFYDDPKFGWGDLAAGGMEIHEIPGNHTSIVKSPVLAEKLKICLEKAQANA